MKKAIVTILILAAFPLITVAKVTTLIINIYGEYEVEVEAARGQYAVVSQWGEILDINMEGRAKYYSDFWDYEAGKIQSIGSVNFSYYSDFWDYEDGKVKKIGNVNFSYNSDFWDYESGKLSRIGKLSAAYYSDFNDNEAGKLKSLGNIRFKYDHSGRLAKINGESVSYRQPHRPNNRRWYTNPNDARPGRPGRGEQHRPHAGSGGSSSRWSAPTVVAEIEKDGIMVYVIDNRRHR